MKTKKHQSLTSRGFVLVASRRYIFYKSAILCAETLREHYPDANITLFTHEEWVDDDCDIFDKVITSIPTDKRAKMWALARTPYDLTMYLDADVQIHDPEIATCFDIIPDDVDILMTRIRPYAAAITQFPGGELTWHCGVFLFRKNKIMCELMQRWYDDYNERQTQWKFDENLYPRSLQPWDTWTFWKLINIDGYNDKINIGRFPDDARWNFHYLRYGELENKSIIIYHNTIRKSYNHERDLIK